MLSLTKHTKIRLSFGTVRRHYIHQKFLMALLVDRIRCFSPALVKNRRECIILERRIHVNSSRAIFHLAGILNLCGF